MDTVQKRLGPRETRYRVVHGRCRGAVRPYLLGGLFLIAVLFIGARLLNRGEAPAPTAPSSRVPTDTSDESVQPGRASGAASARDAVIPPSSGLEEQSEPLTENAEQSAANFSFTVAVAPLILQTDNQAAVRAFRALYSAFLTELRAIPHLALFEVIDGADELTPDDADFLIRVSANSRIEAEPIWSFDVRWTALRGGTGSWVGSELASDPLAFEAIAGDAAAALQRFPFPPEETRILELESRVLDTNLTFDERYDALEELQDIPRRYEFVGRDEQRIVSVAAVEIVANSGDPDIRGRVWKAMGDARADDPYLIGPLVDSVLNDPSDSVRMEAVKLLARTFEEDPRASAAIDYVLSSDPSSEVIMHARWELLDEQGRIDRVRSTVLNPSLSDTERLALLVADVRGIHSYIEQALETAYFGVQIGGGSAEPSTDSPEVTPLLLELLEDRTSPGTRRLAASMLFQRFDEDGVREALEHTAENDPSRSLRTEILWALFQKRATTGSN